MSNPIETPEGLYKTVRILFEGVDDSSTRQIILDAYMWGRIDGSYTRLTKEQHRTLISFVITGV